MSGGHVFSNTGLVSDLIDYSDPITNDSFILSLDFYKAYDTVEHPLIFLSRKPRFGSYFGSATSSLYANGNSSVK